MPSSSVRAYTEPEEYAGALRNMTAKFTVAQRGTFVAKQQVIDLHRLRMHRRSEVLARISYVEVLSERAIIVFRTQPGPPVIRNGVELNVTSISRLRHHSSYFQSTSGLTSHGGMSLPVDEMASLGAAILGSDLTLPKDDLTVTPSPKVMSKLQRLHQAAGQLAEDAPAVLAHLEAARSLEQALIEAMIACLGGQGIDEDRAALRQHAAIMRRFHRTVEQYSDQPLYIPELCREVGASERTLRACCQEHLGMSPKHYLLLRRMYLVRRALRRSTPADTTVTEIATRYGFWQFGRLAVEYKALFGESPSITLARPS